MSMILSLRRVSDKKIESLLVTPGDIVWFLTGAGPPDESDFLAKLLGEEKPDGPQAPGAWVGPSGDEEIDLDKAWHGIHYLLTGTAWEGNGPENFIILGGREIGNVDVGYGPARAFSSGEVTQISSALHTVSDADLRKRYAPEKMDALEIYPVMYREEGESAFDDLRRHFHMLRAFIASTEKKDEGLILYLT
ncbi:DUF1877 domain-containing protein [Desulfonema ishimotonii]|uniref:DUF1877 domain-containing protein n=1 Tax=Desulfonema ishimotonii TaxID=45657 RepID=A0A401FX14_9BACT|nr:YfbM family protein [Desulfonema ishimotonii]GBC61501.1 DUF1877 domain-containing protein [Desulfonema ishimotonii]